VEGTSPTALRAKDGYLTGSATNFPITFTVDNLTARTIEN
jgi:hypothetical protein